MQPGQAPKQAAMRPGPPHLQRVASERQAPRCGHLPQRPAHLTGLVAQLVRLVHHHHAGAQKQGLDLPGAARQYGRKGGREGKEKKQGQAISPCTYNPATCIGTHMHRQGHSC